MAIKTFYIGKSLDDPKKATVMFQDSKIVLYDFFIYPKTKPVFEASGHLYEGTKIINWLC